MHRVSVRVRRRREYQVRYLPADGTSSSSKFVPLERGYEATAIDLIERETGQRVSVDEIDWNIAPEPRYTEATLAALRKLEVHLASEYPSAGLDEADVQASMDEVDDLMRDCPDQLDGYADVRWLVVESMLSMLDSYFEPFLFDREVVWSHGRVITELSRDFAHMPADWRDDDLQCFALMAYPEESTDLRDLRDESGNWTGLKNLAALYNYLRHNFDDRVDELDGSMLERLRDCSAGPTHYGGFCSYDSEYGYEVRIPYTIINRLRELGRLEWFLTHPDDFDRVWVSFAEYAGPIHTRTELRDFLTIWGDPTHLRPVPAEYFEEYAGLPDIMLDFWRDIGFGGFGGGLVWACDPHDWQPVVDAWLGGVELPEDRRGRPIPVFRTAFGEIYCYTVGHERTLNLDAVWSVVRCSKYAPTVDTLIDYCWPDFLSLGVRLAPHGPGVFQGIVERLGPLGPDTMYSFGPRREKNETLKIDSAVVADWRTELLMIREAVAPSVWS